MKNIFSLFQGYVDKPKRNVFDMSFNNNFSTEFGKLTPVFCKPVVPGESYKLDTALGMRLMPMAFPIQTPIKAYVHYFYVRNRALWKDWQDFITGVKSNLQPPFIDVANYTSEQKKEFFKVGGLADYLGIPNVVYSGSSEGAGTALNFNLTSRVLLSGISGRVPTTGGDISTTVTYDTFNIASQWLNINDLNSNKYAYSFTDSSPFHGSSTLVNTTVDNIYDGISRNIKNQLLRNYLVGWPTVQIQWQNELNDILNYNNEPTNTNSQQQQGKYNVVPLTMFARIDYSPVFADYFGSFFVDYNTTFSDTLTSKYGHIFALYVGTDGRVKGSAHFSGTYVDNNGTARLVCSGVLVPEELKSLDLQEILLFDIPYVSLGTRSLSSTNLTLHYDVNSYIPSSVTYQISESSAITPVVIGEGNYSNTPYDEDISLNALPFRAYECIYNSYYRNMQNNPYILNGVEEYNKFIPTNEGGADTTQYHCYFRNWEYDFMTSAVHSPQFGVAPLVGITMTGTASFQDENGTTYYAQAELDSDGTITGWSTHSSDMPQGTLRMLMDSVGTGISINDLRNVNSFQRFLENSLRVGLKYRDQIKGHFGVDIQYNELEMPEFIGGMSLDVNVNPISQTSDVQETIYPLGGQVGQGGAFGTSKHSVTKYCDEHGFIIGILSVVPVPVYSQLLPKFFTYRQQLDYFFPEFGHIGYQPILQKEVSPLQTFYNGSDLNKVFGYQRAWYDLIASTDEVHGQLRTTLKDFIMNRTFSGEPALNEDFLLVDPEQCNDVFLSTDSDEFSPSSDKILGQIYFKATKKSPIPKLGIPRLTD